MVLHFERMVQGQTSANILMIYHPVVPDCLQEVAVGTRRNVEAAW